MVFLILYYMPSVFLSFCPVKFSAAVQRKRPVTEENVRGFNWRWWVGEGEGDSEYFIQYGGATARGMHTDSDAE
jgi:hypothetical protein